MVEIDSLNAEELIVASTFASILDEVKKVPISTADMKLGKKVSHIETQERGMQASGVTVVTEDGNRQFFDGVVMTTPLGWLKRNKEGFMPSLDRRLLKAIDSISVGHLEKVSALSANIKQTKPMNARYTSNSHVPTGNACALIQANTPPHLQLPHLPKTISPATRTG
jgi:Flavin containing amine oxidoreductase